MRYVFFLLLLVSSPAIAQMSKSDFFSETNSFLAERTNNGRVDYSAIQKDPATLNKLLTYVETVQLDSLETDEIKAVLINAYNLLVIKQVVDKYPISSPMDVPGFFEGTKFKVAGEKWTLNHIENEVLRKKYLDPRYHFVLVCGAVGCPSIASFAYMPDKLDTQLNAQTKKALNDTNFVYQKDGSVYLSEIFSWYKGDFKIDGKSELDYINGFKEEKFTSTKVKYYPYDWKLNELKVVQKDIIRVPNLDVAEQPNLKRPSLQTFTAGSLLRKGQWDFTLFNTIYTQTKSNWLGNDFSGFRETFFTSLLQVTYGSSKSKRWNIGLDVNFKSSAYSSDSTASSVWRAFDFKNNDTTRVGVSSLGPRIKFQPFKQVGNFTIQSTFLIPTIEHPEGNNDLYWSDWNRYTSWNQLFFTKTWTQFQLFAEADLLFRIRRNQEQITHVDLPVTLIGSYFPTPKITLYGIASHNTRYTYDVAPQTSNDWVIPMNYTSLGAGFKYQPASNITLELLYTNFVRGANSGLGSTFNIGIKYLTK